MKLSKRAYSLKGQRMFQILAHAKELEKKGKSIIHLELGDPDFETPLNIINAAKIAMDSGATHYSPSQGRWELLHSAQEVTRRSRGFRPKINQMLVTAGANVAIYYALACICNPGDEVIVGDPGFASYFSILKYLDVTIKTIPLVMDNDFKPMPADIKKKITRKTKAIIINSPSNPCGSVLNAKESFEIFCLAEKYDLAIVSDEIYARMVYDDSFSSLAWDRCNDRVVIINGFSKSYAMTGWRLGVTTGPPNLIKRMQLLLETTSSCVNTFVQLAGVEALLGDQGKSFKMLEAYRARRDILVDGLNQLAGVGCVLPKGAFYAFPSIRQTGLTSEEYAAKALEQGVALVPGTAFGKNGEGFVRLCFANSEGNIKTALKRLRGIKK